MKKQLLWALMLLLAGFSSCQKDSFKPAATSNPAPDKVKTNVTNPTYRYVDLVLQARKPGENFDTYMAQGFGPAPLIVTGTPSWNSDMYPVLQNGVPGVQYGITAADGYNSAVTNDLGSGSFVETTGTFLGFNAAVFRADVASYNQKESIFEALFLNGTVPTGLPPMISDYVKATYDQPGIITTTGKVIRVTTGSHWAIATIDYPLPAVSNASPSNPLFLGGVTDPANPNKLYHVFGFGGKITKVSPDEANSASGTYTATSNSFIYTVTITVVRKDGTSFTWTGNTIDLS
ncbi:hypothetical protein ACFFGT_23825 [Mucilaginibacter angelicae]|uniref:Uncharacterized protein n=1 Tax=Mucilaginibacter angelicae TaxID=869718 RepID=A0ABV6LCZ2_9SPHI